MAGISVFSKVTWWQILVYMYSILALGEEYTNVYATGDESMMPFRVIATISERGRVMDLRFSVTARASAIGTLGSLAPVEVTAENMRGDGSLTANDEWGNRWVIRRSHRREAIRLSFSKSLPSATFTVAEVPVVPRPTYREVHTVEGGRSYVDPHCPTDNDPSKLHSCCDAIVDGSYYVHHKYSLEDTGSEGPVYCTSPPSAVRFLPESMVSDYPTIGFRIPLTINLDFLGISVTDRIVITHRPNEAVVIETTESGLIQLTSTMNLANLSTFLNRPQKVSLCSRASFNTQAAQPFLVPWNMMGDALHRLQLSPRTYAAERGCAPLEQVPLGYYISPEGSTLTNGDQFFRFEQNSDYNSPFNGHPQDENRFSCSWTRGYDGAAPSGPTISLTCDHTDTLHVLSLNIRAPRNMLQPQFSFATLSGVQGVYDVRTRRLRLTTSVWASGEFDADTSAFATMCSFSTRYVRSFDSTALSRRGPARRTIPATEIAPIHALYSDLKLKYVYGTNVTKLHNTRIGTCFVRIDVAGVKGLYEYFPKLKNVSIPIMAFRSVPYNYKGRAQPRAPPTDDEVLFGSSGSDGGVVGGSNSRSAPIPPASPLGVQTKMAVLGGVNVATSSTVASSAVHNIPLTTSKASLTSSSSFADIMTAATNTAPSAIFISTPSESTNSRPSLGHKYEDALLTHAELRAKGDIATSSSSPFPQPRTDITLPPKPIEEFKDYPTVKRDKELGVVMGADGKVLSPRVDLSTITLPKAPYKFMLDPIYWRSNEQRRREVERLLLERHSELSVKEKLGIMKNLTNGGLTQQQLRESQQFQQLLLNSLNNKASVRGARDGHPLLTDDGLWKHGVDPKGRIVEVGYHNDNARTFTGQTSCYHPSDTSNPNTATFDHKDTVYGLVAGSSSSSASSSASSTPSSGTTSLQSAGGASSPSKSSIQLQQSSNNGGGKASLESTIVSLTRKQQEERDRAYSSQFDTFMRTDPFFKPAFYVAIVGVAMAFCCVLLYLFCYGGRALGRRLMAKEESRKADRKRRKEEKRQQQGKSGGGGGRLVAPDDDGQTLRTRSSGKKKSTRRESSAVGESINVAEPSNAQKRRGSKVDADGAKRRNSSVANVPLAPEGFANTLSPPKQRRQSTTPAVAANPNVSKSTKDAVNG